MKHLIELFYLLLLPSHTFHITVTNKFVEPNSDEDTWSDNTIKEYETNAKAPYALIQTLNDDDLSRVIYCTSKQDLKSVKDFYKCLKVL